MSKGLVALLAWPFGILLAIGWGMVPSPRRAVHSGVSRQEARVATTASAVDYKTAKAETQRAMEASGSYEAATDVAVRVSEAMAEAEAANAEAHAARAEARAARAEARARAGQGETHALQSEAIAITRSPMSEMPSVPSMLTYFLLATGPGVFATARWRRSVVQARLAT